MEKEQAKRHAVLFTEEDWQILTDIALERSQAERKPCTPHRVAIEMVRKEIKKRKE